MGRKWQALREQSISSIIGTNGKQNAGDSQYIWTREPSKENPNTETTAGKWNPPIGAQLLKILDHICNEKTPGLKPWPTTPCSPWNVQMRCAEKEHKQLFKDSRNHAPARLRR